MSNIGKYMWGESEDNFLSDIFDTIEECKNDIAVNRNDITRSHVYIGQITREFGYRALALNMSSMAKDMATEFDADAFIDVNLWKRIEGLLKVKIDMRPFKLRTVEKVKLEDLL
jgi:hypothetical protein